MDEAIILAGGESKRLKEKAFLKIGGKTIIERELEVLSQVFSKVIIVTNSPSQYRFLKVDLVSDIYPHKGPLSGLYSGLKISGGEYSFVVSCDLPFLNPDLISYLREKKKGYDIVVPKVGEFIEPLHAFYSKKCLSPIKDALLNNRLSVKSFFPTVRVNYIKKAEIEKFVSPEKVFFNVNTPADLNEAQKILDRS